MTATIDRFSVPSAKGTHAHLDDDALFDAWQRGDLRAADALVRRHDTTVRRFLERRVGKNVDDAVQNVWIAITGCHDRFQRRCTFRAYLLGVARNQAYEAQRHLIRARRFDPFRGDELIEPRLGVDVLLDRMDVGQRVAAALAVLTAETRQVIELYYFDRLSARRLGQQLGIGTNTARSRVRRATERLQTAMRRRTSISAQSQSRVREAQ